MNALAEGRPRAAGLPMEPSRLHRPAEEAAFGHAILTETQAGLSRIRDTRINLVLWRRTIAPWLASWLDRQPFSAFPNARARIKAADSRDGVASLFAGGALPPGVERDALVEDLAELVVLFAAAAGEAEAVLRLEAMTGAGCERFHVDFVPFRLLTAYRGAGLEWLPEPVAERMHLTGRDPEDILVEQAPRFAAALFKGQGKGQSREQGGHGTPLVHRSPRLMKTGRQPVSPRFIACLSSCR